MTDKILEGFLRRQLEEGMALAAASDLVDLTPADKGLPRRYVVEYRCKGLVRKSNGDDEIVEADRFAVGIRFPSEYLRHAEPAEVLTWLGPRNVWHPNIMAPVICVGRLTPGTPLVDIVYQVFDIITLNKVTVREDDALNPSACQWARHNMHRFPIDRRPLKRRVLRLEVKDLAHKAMATREGSSS
jgi:hypothetical protein